MPFTPACTPHSKQRWLLLLHSVHHQCSRAAVIPPESEDLLPTCKITPNPTNSVHHNIPSHHALNSDCQLVSAKGTLTAASASRTHHNMRRQHQHFISNILWLLCSAPNRRAPKLALNKVHLRAIACFCAFTVPSARSVLAD